MNTFSEVSKSVQIRDENGKTRYFPARGDYVSHLQRTGLIANAAELPQNPELVEDVYLDWLKRGQIGCVFGQLFARKRFRTGFKTVVIGRDASIESDAQSSALEIDHAVAECLLAPEVEALTVLLPAITQVDSAVRLFVALSRLPNWKLESVNDWGATLINIGLRVRLQEENDTEEEVWAEILGTGPFVNSLPATRQSPIMSLEMRTKTLRAKYSKLYPRKIKSAHLDKIDYEGVVDPVWFGRLFEKYTPWLRKRILGGASEDRRAKASVTLTVPVAVWNAMGRKEPGPFRE
jgi:hypothetical protein